MKDLRSFKENGEKINHPKHYNRVGRKECIEEMIDLFGVDEVIIFCKLNAYKYDYRKGLKGDYEEDAKKAEWYRNKIRELQRNC